MAFDQVLRRLAEKWREVPSGTDRDERRLSNDMLQLSQVDLLAEWTNRNRQGAELRDWWWGLYADLFRNWKILEIGSGIGFDALHFAQTGATWTCCDIAETNLQIIAKVAEAKRIPVQTFLITSLASFSALPSDFDAVWCCGSIIHLPFAEAQEECRAILSHLKPGGRWIELAYPRERWQREGAHPFNRWGDLTDGVGTPWVEWYDMEKLKQRLFPFRLRPLLEHRFHGDQYVWLDAQISGRHDEVLLPDKSCGSAGPFTIGEGLWRQGSTVTLPPFEVASVTVDIDCSVTSGTVGLYLECDGRQISRESFVEARIGGQVIHLSTDEYGEGARLAMRNASALGPAGFALAHIAIRPRL